MQSVIFRNRIDAANELTERLYWLKDEVQENNSPAVIVLFHVEV